jgi:FMN phosphatase YigB (HAD superfamily)
MKKLNVQPNDIVFYDDLYENTKAVEKLGVQTVHVNWEKGLQMSDVLAQLAKYCCSQTESSVAKLK